MHILIIHQAFASLNEPGGTRHHEFARLLTAHGHQVTVIASPVSYITGSAFRASVSSEVTEDKVTILRASVYDAHHRSFLHRIVAFFSFMLSSFWVGLGVKNVDLVWGTSPPIFQGVTAWVLARIKGAKFLFEVRDLWPQFAIAVGVLKNPVLILLSEWLERFLYRRADRVMVNSPGFLEPVTSRGAKRVELIPNGADPSMFDPNNDGMEFRRSNQLMDKFVVLYAGAHGMSNDLEVVLDAAALLVDRNEIQLVLLGDGKEKPALMARAQKMDLTNVTFLPSVPKTEMASALAGADACLAILKPLEEYKTTYPNKVFDYMAAGRPVVLAIDGVIREVVEAAGCGIFAAPGSADEVANAIRQLAADKKESRIMGLQGRDYLQKNFSRAAIGEKLLGLLEDLRSK
ncbi:MAG TPA: glycosyltransferase family 4 protein [Anaerolineales bacterium]|nr:glycosyltransferase family 4 protein [Anaerolineales bacterium]HMX75088.1 glycosyltransferase family 4 protein [Anaerolineales bacterium]HNF36030.1 glycosyltransferase family 4 protein [Anaerolineales bacterium]HNH05004.1 glycosyltransferase family 4 protein [Anaerolineales bacterium]HNH79745.1 glycosyltransferase family 4 protein [Anaerolineales bacterium]